MFQAFRDCSSSFQFKYKCYNEIKFIFNNKFLIKICQVDIAFTLDHRAGCSGLVTCEVSPTGHAIRQRFVQIITPAVIPKVFTP